MKKLKFFLNPLSVWSSLENMSKKPYLSSEPDILKCKKKHLYTGGDMRIEIRTLNKM